MDSQSFALRNPKSIRVDDLPWIRDGFAELCSAQSESIRIDLKLQRER